MKKLLTYARALLAIVTNKTDEYRYRMGTAILRLPFADEGWLLQAKLTLAGWIANDQHTGK